MGWRRNLAHNGRNTEAETKYLLLPMGSVSFNWRVPELSIDNSCRFKFYGIRPNRRLIKSDGQKCNVSEEFPTQSLSEVLPQRPRYREPANVKRHLNMRIFTAPKSKSRMLQISESNFPSQYIFNNLLNFPVYLAKHPGHSEHSSRIYFRNRSMWDNALESNRYGMVSPVLTHLQLRWRLLPPLQLKPSNRRFSISFSAPIHHTFPSLTFRCPRQTHYTERKE